MQILPPIKTYTLRSGRNHTPIQPPVKPTQTNNTTNGEKNGDKENVMPGTPEEVVTQKKKGIVKVVKPVSDSKVLTEPVRQGIVVSVSRRRKALTKFVTLEADSSGEVIGDSNVLTEPVKQGVAIVSLKRKAKLVTPEEDSGVSIAKVVTPKRKGIVKVSKPVSSLAVPKSVEPVKQSVAIVSRKRKAKPVTPEEDSGVSIAKVITPKRKGIVQTDVDDVSNGKTASASKKIKKPTLVPSTVIPSISQAQASDYDDDSQLNVEENAYQQQLVQTQIAASQKSGKGKGKVKKDLPEGTTIFCTKCHEVFDTADELSVHENKCFFGRCYPCPYPSCSRVNSQNSLLDEHIKGVHENNPFRCKLCPQEVFIYKKSYNKNFKRYRSDAVNSKSFVSKVLLRIKWKFELN